MSEPIGNSREGDPPKIAATRIAAVVAGNTAEFYDFLLFAFFAPQIGRSFFPAEDSVASLLATLAAFGSGFAMRPVGALFIGRVADRHGRVPAMRLNFLLMAMSMLGFAALPTHAQIGAAAPIFAVILRLLQGFAIGGEVGPSTAYLIEAVPPRHRGLFASFQFTGQNAAILLASLIGYLLSSWMNERDLADWGWRLAFLLGGALLCLTYPLRRNLDETLPKQPAGPVTAPMPDTRFLLLACAVLAQATISIYVLINMVTFAATTLSMSVRDSFLPTLAVGITSVICCPLGGMLSDRTGRKPIMIGFAALLLLVALPGFRFVLAMQSVALLVCWCVLAAACSSLASVTAFISITESLPTTRRSLLLGLLYAAVVTLFGGTTPLIIAWLIVVTGTPLIPALYLTAALIVGVAAMIQMRETAPCRTRALVSTAA